MRDEGWIAKGVNGAGIILKVTKINAEILVEYKGVDRVERRDRVFPILEEIGIELKKRETPKVAQIQIPVIDKGRDDVESWDEIRERLTSIGEQIYYKIDETNI